MKLDRIIGTTALITTLALTPTAFADPPAAAATAATRPPSAPEAPRPIYRFEFAIRRADDAPNARTASYVMHLAENQPGTLSVGSNIPLQSASTTHPNMAPRQDVGLVLHFNFSMQAGTVVLSGTVEISGAEPMTNGIAAIRRFRADGAIPVVPGRPALFANVTDPATHNTYEITVTATRVP
jgi:hypothetical protein